MERTGEEATTPQSAAAPRQAVALVAGATAGHIAPSFAVAEALRRLAPEVECILVVSGTTRGGWILEGARLPVETIEARPWYGVGLAQRAQLPLHILKATRQARAILRRRRVGVVLAFGGFGSLEASLAACSLRIPLFVHEANARAGVSTRLAARLAERIFLSEQDSAAAFPSARTTVIGMPVRAAFLGVAQRRRARREAAKAAGDATLRVLVTGGSLGSAFLDRRFPGVAARLRSRGIELHVTHLAREDQVDAVAGAYRRASLPAVVQSRCLDMAAALVEADFVVSQAGASSLAELAAAESAALFVPLDGHAADHQSANLVAASRRAPLWWIREQDWHDSAVADGLASRLRDPSFLTRAEGAMRGLAARDAAARIAEACLVRLRGERP